MTQISNTTFSDKTKIKLIFSSFVLVNMAIFFILYYFFFFNQIGTYTLLQAEQSIEENKKTFNRFLNNTNSVLLLLRESNAFTDYLENKKGAQSALSTLFNKVAASRKDIMQIRYLNKNGLEKIRLNQDSSEQYTTTVTQKDLQDKSARPYFIEAARSSGEDIFFTNIELNMEHGVVEMSPKQTIRAVMPIYVHGSFEGALIINFYVKKVLEDFFADPRYEAILVDANGNILLTDEKTKSKELHISTLLPEYYNEILTNKTSVKGSYISHKLMEKEDSSLLILRPNPSYIEEMNVQQYKEFALFFLVMILLSIIITVIVSRIVNRLNLDLFEKKRYQHQLDEYFKLIDRYIITSKTDLKGIITYASKAFCKISGYSREELMGKNHRLVRHPDMEASVFETLWNDITSNRTWNGELKNLAKDGNSYWVVAHIEPEYDFNGEKIGYTAIRENITEQKTIEKIAITDSLTSLYNRQFFNEFMPKVLNSAKRNREIVCFAMIDIDHFKLYNDTYGHTKGDAVLEGIGKLMLQILKRSNDYAFRFGGEEFAVILIGDSCEKAAAYIENLRKEIEALDIEHCNSTTHHCVTVSIGIACESAVDLSSMDQLYERADKQLYQAKNVGRNKVVAEKKSF